MTYDGVHPGGRRSLPLNPHERVSVGLAAGPAELVRRLGQAPGPDCAQAAGSQEDLRTRAPLITHGSGRRHRALRRERSGKRETQRPGKRGNNRGRKMEEATRAPRQEWRRSERNERCMGLGKTQGHKQAAGMPGAQPSRDASPSPRSAGPGLSGPLMVAAVRSARQDWGCCLSPWEGAGSPGVRLS